MEAIDVGAARKAVCAWLDEHQGGTLAQMAEDLKRRYLAYPDEMAVIRPDDYLRHNLARAGSRPVMPTRAPSAASPVAVALPGAMRGGTELHRDRLTCRWIDMC